MREIVVVQDSSASADAVWAVMTDIEASANVISGIEKVERLDDGDGFGVGLSWRETRVMLGREATEEMTVTAVDEAGHSYVVEAESRGTRYRSVLAVAPAGDGCTISMRFAAEPQSGLSRLLGATMGRMFEGATRTALQQDLRDIAAAAESA